MPVYMVDRDLPGIKMDQLAAAQKAAIDLSQKMTAQGKKVRDPKPRKDQVLVHVRACAMNHLDIWVRKGLPGVNLPHILGSDVSGEVVETGEYVTGFQPGQRVLLAPMNFCNRCSYCTSGRHNQCPEFTVLGNRVDGGNCELIAVPAVN